MMNDFIVKYGNWVIKYRKWIITLTTLFIIFAAAGIQKLVFLNDSRIFFSKDNPQLKALETLENTFTKDINVFFAIAPENKDVFTRETLAVVEEFTEACWQIPYSSRVDSITNFQHTHVMDDDLIVEDLVQEANSLSDSDLSSIKKIALKEPLLVNRLISPAGHVTGINVNIIKPDKSMNESPEVTAFARKLAGDFQKKYPDLEIYLSGGAVIDTAFGEAAQNDLETLVPLMYIVLLVILGIFLRSVSGTLSTLIIILFSMFTGMGLAGWLGIEFTMVSATAPTIILTLAVADSVHLLVTLFQGMRQGQCKKEAILESLRINTQPVFLTSLTTAIGFLTMNFSDVPPFRDLGNIVAIGVTAAFIYSILFLPALMAVLPLKIKPLKDKTKNPSCNRLADFVLKHQKILFWSTLFVITTLALGIFRIELNDNFIKYFDHRYEFRRASDFIEENLTGFDIIEYSLKSGEAGGINDPNFLKTVEKFASWYSTQAKVIHVNTVTDTIKRLNKNMHNNAPLHYKIPDHRELAAQYLLLYEMSLPFGLDLNNQINVDKSTLRMTVTFTNVSAVELREADTRAREWLKTNAPENMFTYGTGLSIMFAHISERNIKSMLGASIGALFLISVILILALKNVKLGIISLIPNLTPAFMAFGVWGLLFQRLGLAASVLAALTLGIVVDDTVHFMNKYLRARREYNFPPAEAVRYAFNTVGTALWITTAALVAGFLVLSFSGFKVNSDMGLITAITITLALILDFLFLPILLIKTEGKTYESHRSDYNVHIARLSDNCKGTNI